MILHCLGKHKKDSFARCLSRFLPVPICFLHCSTRGASRARCARNARCACHSHARCTSGTSNTRGSRRTRGASYARRARNACHSHARWASGTSDARRYGNLWEYMSLFRLSEVVEMFVADKFVIYMYVAGVCLTVLFSDSNKVYQLNTHLPRQRFTSSILF